MQCFVPWFFFFSLLLTIPETLKGQADLYSFAQRTIAGSANIKPGKYVVNTMSLGENPFITIQGDNIEIDFNNAVIDGRGTDQLPNDFSGIAIHIKDSKNVTIKNLKAHGFKIAILAENVESLQILSCNLSYNYRPKLYSRWDREALSDWLYYHNNENDEWKRYGAAIYLKQCNNALIKSVMCHQGMNGILMVQCSGALVYNNDIRFNSGLGIGMYRSSFNRIMHNRFDWNARGYSYGQYARGQDSSAILLYEQSSHNTFAFNSGTHSGDGLFLWAGQHTMDTGQGGCDSNMIYRNDFSHSIANGIEVTFSANYMIENLLDDSRYGVWGGYSHHSVIRGNRISDCETGIAIEHGRYNLIEENEIKNGKRGIQLWARESQPPDWPYANALNVKSRQYKITRNRLADVNIPFEITNSDSIEYNDNVVLRDGNILPSPVHDSMQTRIETNWVKGMMHLPVPDPLPDGIDAKLKSDVLRGRKYIIVNEWGPYDFQFPLLALRRKEPAASGELLHFEILGPEGSWNIDSIRGYAIPDQHSGKTGDTLVVFCHSDSTLRYLELVYKGFRIINQFGDTIPESQRVPFHYAESCFKMDWDIAYYAYDETSDPLKNEKAFKGLLSGTPLFATKSPKLAYKWWGKPVDSVPEEMFAVKATASFYTSAGDYTLEVESDDGIRVWLDGELLLERWDIHTPTIDEVQFSADEGKHILMVEYFEATGLAVLDITVRNH